MSRCAHLYFFANFDRNSAAVMLPAGRAAKVAHVGEVGLELRHVLLPERHLPCAVTRIDAALQELRGQCFVVGEEPAGVRPQRDDAGAGERRDVDHAGGVEALGVGERVVEDEASLGVGVEDLDRDAGHRSDDVAGAARVAAGHVLDRRHESDDVERELQPRERLEQADHAARAAHVVLHLVQQRAGLQRNAAGVERDALAHQHHGLVVLRTAVVLHDDELARRVRRASDRQQRTHAELFHVGALEHFDLELEFLAQRLRGLREVARVADVAAQVAQVLGQRHAFGDRHAVLRGGFERLVDLAGDEQRDLLHAANLGTLLLARHVVLVGAVGEQARGELHARSERTAGHVAVGHADDGIGRVGRGEHPRPADQRGAHGRIAEVLALAQADQQHAFGRHARQVLQHQRRARCVFEVAALQLGGDLAAGRGVERLRGAGQRAVGEHANGDDAGLDGGRRTGDDGNIHGIDLEWEMTAIRVVRRRFARTGALVESELPDQRHEEDRHDEEPDHAAAGRASSSRRTCSPPAP